MGTIYFGTDGDLTLDDTAGGTNGSTTKAPTSNAFYDHAHTAATASVQGHATAAQITKLDGIATGADVTANNNPKAHTSSHAVGGTDTVFPADPGADKILKWDDDPGQLVWADEAGGGGDITTDDAWTAAGDLIVGTGADTASVVSIGAEEIVARIGAGNIDGIAVAEQRIVGRATGESITGLTAAQVKTLCAYLTDLADDTTPELAGNLVIGTHSLHLDEALSSDHTYSGVTFDGIAGEQIDASQSFGKLCYRKFSDGKWYLADKDAESTASGSLGICVSTGAKTTDDALLLAGPGTYVRDDTWAFDEDVQFVGDSGALADGTASDAYESGDQIRVVGRA